MSAWACAQQLPKGNSLRAPCCACQLPVTHTGSRESCEGPAESAAAGDSPEELQHHHAREACGQLSRAASWQHSEALPASCCQQHSHSESRDRRGRRSEAVPASHRQLSRKGEGGFSRPAEHTSEQGSSPR